MKPFYRVPNVGKKAMIREIDLTISERMDVLGQLMLALVL